MKKAIIAMLLMAIFMVGGGGIVSIVFTSLLGGGTEQSYIYPLYGAAIVLTGIIVGATQIVISEIRELKENLKDK
ncbi:conserved exported protein of unknown function [Tepidanaerobacter acetatoxydans Re1]|uniref:Uncharacterized protein n=1 Tax=Tepidanaerobacter acetatoxydans (strain DSM 21804 / JCM 16047 / Re1) TaxID=1209989 RepID=F4LXI6_TEPAE|nr:hypothetical protein [Tepidanaerobacter acetatoxydans]AEE91088.1 hypothetical protein TepRe1_0921 [Tepidanaerobacter acetatoxydans Re1]CCP25722.1 conserved exported protein of unknown function [Tepidanaerobacter acetatoxydans Re1]